MKLDPGIHIAMHSVLSLKPGVTTINLKPQFHKPQHIHVISSNCIPTEDAVHDRAYVYIRTVFGFELHFLFGSRNWDSSEMHVVRNWKSPVYILQLSQKSDFQPSTTKPDNTGHPTVKTGQI